MGWETPIKTDISRCHRREINIMWLLIIKQNKTKHHTQNACVCVWVVYARNKSSLLRMYVYQSISLAIYQAICLYVRVSGWLSVCRHLDSADTVAVYGRYINHCSNIAIALLISRGAIYNSNTMPTPSIMVLPHRLTITDPSG